MFSHLRAGLGLLLVSVVLCCVVYPLLLWGIGMGLFPHAAHGSLIDAKGQPTNDPDKAVGSRLIAQSFSDDRYFWPRPSAAGYNAAASAASNWGANNPLLRGRIAQTLGPVVKYGAREAKKGQLVGPDIVTWFIAEDKRVRAEHKPGAEDKGAQDEDKPGLVAQWAETYPSLAQAWVKQDDLHKEAVKAWAKAHQKEVDKWIQDNPGTPNPNPEDLAVLYLQSISHILPGQWPRVSEVNGTKKIEVSEPGDDDKEVQAIFFDMWRQAHPDVDLQEVPGDYVFASGSGLDPHITLDNALYQLNQPGRLAEKWAEQTKRPVKEIRAEIEKLLHDKAEAPLNGLVGVKMVNVLEVNLALRNKYQLPNGRPSEK